MSLPRTLFTLALLMVTAGVSRAAPGAWDTAVVLYRSRQFSAARAVFLTAAAAEPANRAVDFYLGRIALWFNDEEEAEARLNLAAAAAPNDAQVQNALGDLYGLRAQTAAVIMRPHWACQCRSAYARAIALAPDEIRYHWSLLGFCLVAPRIVGGGTDRARREAVAISRLDDLQGRIANATIALHANQASEAFAQFEPVLRNDPDNFLALYQTGRCAAVSGERLTRGLAALRRCLHLIAPPGPDVPTFANVHQRIGDILTKFGDSAAAAAEYTEVRRLEPDFAPQKLILRF